MCQQHIDEHCPVEVMCLRSIRGKQAIKVLLRFTQQLKPKCRSKLSVLAQRYTAAYLFQHPCFTQTWTCFTGKKKVSLKLRRHNIDC